MSNTKRRQALAHMHDPRFGEWERAEQNRRHTPEVLAMVEAHKLEVARLVGPAAWELNQSSADGERRLHRGERLAVIWSISLEADGRPWLHVSGSHPSRVPWHVDMAKIKDTFIGDRYAYAIWPPRDRYVNMHDHVLHLWSPWWDLEEAGPPLPEFSVLLPNGDRTV